LCLELTAIARGYTALLQALAVTAEAPESRTTKLIAISRSSNHS
jgi:hypothetical protein